MGECNLCLLKVVNVVANGSIWNRLFEFKKSALNKIAEIWSYLWHVKVCFRFENDFPSRLRSLRLHETTGGGGGGIFCWKQRRYCVGDVWRCTSLSLSFRERERVRVRGDETTMDIRLSERERANVRQRGWCACGGRRRCVRAASSSANVCRLP